MCFFYVKSVKTKRDLLWCRSRYHLVVGTYISEGFPVGRALNK